MSQFTVGQGVVFNFSFLWSGVSCTLFIFPLNFVEGSGVSQLGLEMVFNRQLMEQFIELKDLFIFYVLEKRVCIRVFPKEKCVFQSLFHSKVVLSYLLSRSTQNVLKLIQRLFSDFLVLKFYFKFQELTRFFFTDKFFCFRYFAFKKKEKKIEKT